MMQRGSLLCYRNSQYFDGTVGIFRFCIHMMERGSWVNAVVKLQHAELGLLLGQCLHSPRFVADPRHHILTSHGIICVSNTSLSEDFRVLK